MDKMLAGKRKAREALAALPFEEKLVLIERMRDRSLLLGANPLRQPAEDTSGKVVPQGKRKPDVSS